MGDLFAGFSKILRNFLARFAAAGDRPPASPVSHQKASTAFLQFLEDLPGQTRFFLTIARLLVYSIVIGEEFSVFHVSGRVFEIRSVVSGISNSNVHSQGTIDALKGGQSHLDDHLLFSLELDPPMVVQRFDSSARGHGELVSGNSVRRESVLAFVLRACCEERKEESNDRRVKEKENNLENNCRMTKYGEAVYNYYCPA